LRLACGAVLAERKDDPLPESTWQLMQEFRAAQGEEQRREEECIKHRNSIYSPAREGEAAPHTAYRIAERMVAQHKRGKLEEAREDTLRLAQAYLDAI
jgi:hypothetical protein